ncbi:MAG: Nif3-like dinuclear metal center hexameric protein [Gammaproteobacteria bacterium]|nr:Nif3-like dinuclear metal center hexameric protein [Gammaproteobacteria bacterium]
MIRTEIVDYLQQLLQPQHFQDYAPNGLQIAGKSTINNVVTAVTASQAVINEAIKKKADVLLVHHGYFWRGEDPCLVGYKHQRIATLIKHNINLIAYHLPLDAHADYGNNVQLAKRLHLSITKMLGEKDDQMLGCIGELSIPMSSETFIKHITQQLRQKPLHIAGNQRDIKTIAWCTGAAQDYITHAASLGVDAYLSGEASERTFHLAKELGIHYFAAGHHATERYGVQALGEHLAMKFNLQHCFINEENPI